MSRNHAFAVVAALALVSLTALPVAAGTRTNRQPPNTGTPTTGGVFDCTNGGSYSTSNQTTIRTGDSCVTLKITFGTSVTNANAGWDLPLGTTVDASTFEVAAGSCTVADPATLQATATGVDVLGVTCSGGQELVVYVNATVASANGDYPLSGSFKTSAGKRTTDNKYRYTYTVSVASGCGPVAPSGPSIAGC